MRTCRCFAAVAYVQYVFSAVDFSCAIESTILIHGRLYLSNTALLFYSNLFGIEKKVKIPYSRVKSFAKAKTALLIPNAIQIVTSKTKYLHGLTAELLFTTYHIVYPSFRGADILFPVVSGQRTMHPASLPLHAYSTSRSERGSRRRCRSLSE
jgi:hypothetical protein